MKNLFYNTIARFGSSLFVVIINIFIARSYQKNEYAVYGYSFAMANILSIFIQGGCPQSLMRFVIADENNIYSYYKKSLEIMARNFLIACVLVAVAAYFGLVKFLNFKNLLAICFWAVFASWQALLCEFYRAKNNLHKSAVLAGGYSYLVSIPMVAASYYFGLEVFFCILSHIVSLVLVCFFYHASIYEKKSNVLSDFLYKKFKKSGIKNMISSGFSTLIIQSPLMLVGHFGGADDIASYSVANRISAIVMMSYSTISQAFSRNISLLVVSGCLLELNNFARKTTKNILFFMAIIYLILFFAGDVIVLNLFGEKYFGSMIYVKIICFGFLFSATTGLRSQFIVQSGGESYLYKISILFGILSLIGGGYFMNYFGVVFGVAFSVAVYCLSCVVEALMLFAKKRINCLPV